MCLSLIVLSALQTDAITINCNYATGNLWNLQNVYFCEAMIVGGGDPRMISAISGNHSPGLTNNEVRGFRVRNQQIPGLPRNLHQYFPNIEAYTVLHGMLSEISREDLKHFPNLRQIDFNFNNIQVLRRNLFEGNSQLEFISFDNNLIRHVAHHVFDNLKLTILALRPNTCINESQVDREAVSMMIFRVFQQCPPTSRMIAEEILYEPELINIIDNRIEERTNEMKLRVSRVEQTTNGHEKRLSYQEVQMKATIDTINLLLSRVFPQG